MTDMTQISYNLNFKTMYTQQQKIVTEMNQSFVTTVYDLTDYIFRFRPV